MKQHKILNEYFNRLEGEDILRLINESEDKQEIYSMGKKIKLISSKVKSTKMDKEKSKKEIKKNRETSQYKKLKKIINNYINKEEGDKNRLRKELDSLYGYAVSNFLTIIISMWSLYKFKASKKKIEFNNKTLTDLIFTLGELPGPIIVKIITRSKKSLNDLNTEMSEEVPITPALEILFSIVFVVGFFLTIPACINVIMLIGLIIKIIWGVILGVKLNSWSYLNKTKNDSV